MEASSLSGTSSMSTAVLEKCLNQGMICDAPLPLFSDILWTTEMDAHLERLASEVDPKRLNVVVKEIALLMSGYSGTVVSKSNVEKRLMRQYLTIKRDADSKAGYAQYVLYLW